MTHIPQNEKLILASSSPRRHQMLSASGIPFIIVIPDIVEEPTQNEKGHSYVLRNSTEKAKAVEKLVEEKHTILAADTIVVTKDDTILEKPQNKSHAISMLSTLSGNTHLVLTGYCLIQNHQVLTTRVIETFVTFRTLSEREIESYILTGEPFDKAGAYGIQGKAMGFVEKIEGSFTNVMGLPLSQVLSDLEQLAGFKTFTVT